jgi:hypothetical protein
MPVDNPVMNVAIRRGKGWYEFTVPINHPRASQMNLEELLLAAELSGLITVSTGHKNNTLTKKKESIKVGDNGKR